MVHEMDIFPSPSLLSLPSFPSLPPLPLPPSPPTLPSSEYYLEDAIEMLHFIPPPQEKKKKKPLSEQEAFEREADVSGDIEHAIGF